MKVVGYRRVSTGRQVEEGHGMDAQRAAIQRRADERGWEVAWVDDPGVSGKDANRPGLDYALHLVRSGEARALVVSKLDRLSRSVLDFATIVKTAQDEKWNLVVLDPDLDLSTPYGKAMANVVITFAELERELIAERTRAGLAAAAEKGIRPGPKPREIPPETVARARELRDQKKTLADIAHALTTEGYPLPSGRCGTWQGNQVRRALAAETETEEARDEAT
jgi:DNA invertase Pin-like site-specific DNA recombinase